MRAFMSDGPRRLLLSLTGLRSDEELATEAIAEAHRIKDETERGLHVHEHTFGEAFPVAIGSFGWGLALADALRAWLED